MTDKLLEDYMSDVSESVPKGAPSSDFADPPSGLYVGDAKHAALAVQAVTGGLEGNKAKARNTPGVKGKIASAIRKFYSGELQSYYLSWLKSGKKPDQRPASDMRVVREMYITAPDYRVEDIPRFPDPPISPGVNMDALLKNDPNPVFVTRPLAILDEVSNNGLPYNRAVYEAIRTQVIRKKPAARRGHVAEADRGSSFPPDEGYWVGLVEDSTVYGKPTLFGKCYTVPGRSMREMAVNRELTGTPLSNSIWGNVVEREDENGNLVPVDLTLETIDFVPEERAALQALGGKFTVTSEMKEDNEEDDMAGDESLTSLLKDKEPGELYSALSEMGNAHKMAEMHLKSGNCAECTTGLHEMLTHETRGRVAEMHVKEATPEETYAMLPDSHRKHVAEMYAKESGMMLKPLGEETKTTAEMTNVSRRLAEMESTIKMYQRKDYDEGLVKQVDAYYADWNVHTPAGKEKLDALKRQHRILTVSEMAGSTKVEDIAPAASKAWEQIKPFAEMTKVAMAGPNAFVGVGVSQAATNPNGYDPQKGRYSDEAVDNAMRYAGMPLGTVKRGDQS